MLDLIAPRHAHLSTTKASFDKTSFILSSPCQGLNDRESRVHCFLFTRASSSNRIRKVNVRDVSGMLVERVFLVSGVEKLFFHLTKKIREVFSFFTTNKKSKADFVGISKSPRFVREVVKTMFSGEHVLYRTHSVENTRDTEHNFWRTCSLLFFVFAGENSMRG